MSTDHGIVEIFVTNITMLEIVYWRFILSIGNCCKWLKALYFCKKMLYWNEYVSLCKHVVYWDYDLWYRRELRKREEQWRDWMKNRHGQKIQERRKVERERHRKWKGKRRLLLRRSPNKITMREQRVNEWEREWKKAITTVRGNKRKKKR